MTTTAFLLDLSRCIGCQACVAACKTGNELAAGTQYIRIGEVTAGSYPDLWGGVLNKRCYHCVEAACVAVCPAKALFKENGMTRVDPDRCTACGYCTTACPFDIPQIVDGRVAKCDGCAAVVNAGGTPWCVKTCPSSALLFGPHDDILAEAHRRVAAINPRYPRARVYGETEAGGLGVIVVLPDAPERFALPAAPQVSGLTGAWQTTVKPATIGLTGLSVLVSGVAAIIARRIHMKELEEIEAETPAALTPDIPEEVQEDGCS